VEDTNFAGFHEMAYKLTPYDDNVLMNLEVVGPAYTGYYEPGNAANFSTAYGSILYNNSKLPVRTADSQDPAITFERASLLFNYREKTYGNTMIILLLLSCYPNSVRLAIAPSLTMSSHNGPTTDNDDLLPNVK
jgi:hypothetical protein